MTGCKPAGRSPEASMAGSRWRVCAVFGAMLAASLAVSADGTDRQRPRRPTASAGEQSPTFTKDVAPILYKHCTTCHRPGEMAPMSLLTFQDVRPWARAIRDNVVKGAMPPWHADPAHGRWLNERRLSDLEKDIIVRWVNSGASQGDPRHLPRTPEYTQGWIIERPDLVVSMDQEFAVPAHGEVKYQYFQVPTNLTEDKWVQALEIRPGNRKVVHHVMVYAKPPQGARRPQVFRSQNPPGPLAPDEVKATEEANSLRARARNWLLSWFGEGNRGDRLGVLIALIPVGRTPIVYTTGTALRLQAGTVLTFQVHYAPIGVPTTDRTSIGFKFARQEPRHELFVRAMQNPAFVIPPGAAHHPVESRLEVLEDVTIYSLAPHTHVRGKSWEYTLIYPDGRSEIILSIPKFDFNWQTDYQLATPLRVPKGSLLKSVAHYDNSPSNKANPDPTQPVYQGDQTWEEMQYTGLLYAIDRESRAASAR